MTSTTTKLYYGYFCLLREIGILFHKYIKLYYDNLSALYIPVNPVFNGRMKHIEIDYHFVWGKVVVGNIKSITCPPYLSYLIS